MIDLLERTLKIEIVEDNNATRQLINHKITKNFEGVKTIVRDNPIDLYKDINYERPLIIILDWFFKGYDCSMILPRLASYKGLICVFSNEDVQAIKKNIKKCLGAIPKNFRVFNKFNYREMEDEIVDYIAENF